MPTRLPALAARAAVVAVIATGALAAPAATPAEPRAAAAPVTAVPAVPSVAVPSATPARAGSRVPVAVAPGNRPAPVRVAVARVASAGPTAGRAPARRTSSAMTSALGKIGAPYRWGASGPRAFDCSGLVQWSFKQAGVSLPHSSRAMARTGTPVSRAGLRPGDLVFFYRPVSHVAIYIGGGKVVHASSSRSPVKIGRLSAMPFTTARRV